MGGRPTIEDIAARSEVSPATVSRALNNPEKVRSGTRERIYAAMRELGYLPPSTKPPEHLSRVIALFAPNLLLDSVTEMVRAVEAALLGSSYDLLLVNMRGERDFGKYLGERGALRKKIDGAIVFSADITDRAAEISAASNTPIVLLQARSSRVRSYSNNNFFGGRDATEFLLSRGYRRIAFVGWTPRDEHVSDRLSGYQAALRDAGVELRESEIAYGSLDGEGGYAATAELLERTSPDAIFYATDVLAVGGLRYFREHNVRIPEELAIMGFDDLSVAGAVGLTTMRQFFERKAQMAVDYLIKRIEGEIRTEHPEELMITPRLVVRQTTPGGPGESG